MGGGANLNVKKKGWRGLYRGGVLGVETSSSAIPTRSRRVARCDICATRARAKKPQIFAKTAKFCATKTKSTAQIEVGMPATAGRQKAAELLNSATSALQVHGKAAEYRNSGDTLRYKNKFASPMTKITERRKRLFGSEGRFRGGSDVFGGEGGSCGCIYG